MKIISEETLKTFEILPLVVEGFFSTLKDETLDVKRGETVWTAREHLYHMVNVQEMLLNRIRLIIDEEHPVIAPFFPENETIRDYASVKEAFAVYRKIRKEQIDTVRGLSQDILLREAVHPEYTEYNIPKIINHMIFHEYWHMYRIEEICQMKEEFFA